MNFFNPLMFEATLRNNNTQSAVAAETIPRYLSGYIPTQVTYREYEPSVQFKVFAFEKVNSGRLNLGDASNVYRFELLENRSFGGFLNVLKGHGISSQSHQFNYVDDEQDLIVLTTEYDFKYMLKIMKGKTIKIVCEKIPQPTAFTCPQKSQRVGFRNIPLFTHHTIRQQESEKLIEHALDSVLSGIFEKKQERPQQVFNPSNAHRVRTIRLSDLLKGTNSQKEEEKPEKKEEKQSRTFEDFLAEVFGKKLAETTSQEEVEQSNKEETKEENVVEQQVIPEEEKKEEPIQSKQEEKQVEETPILTTSQIISNYLIGDDENDDVITEEESEDELPSVASESFDQEIVQYPTLIQEEEQPSNSVPEPTNQQEQPTYEKELKLLSDMGFSDQTENLALLTKYSGDV